MSEISLPEGWSSCKLADIAAVNPKKIDAEPDLVSGFVPMSHAPTDFKGTLDFDEKLWGEIKKSYTNFQNDDVIFAKVTPCFENGKAAIVRDLPNGIGAGSSEFYVLRGHNDDISERFLFALIKSFKFMQEGAQNMTGAVGLRRVPRAFVESFPIDLPPAAEQKVIADKLDQLLAQVESTKARLDRIPDILKRFRQSVLAAAVSGKLTEEWRESADVISAQNLLASLIETRNKKLAAEVEEGNAETKRLLTKIKKHKPNLPDGSLPDKWVWTSFMGTMEKVIDCHNKTAPYIDEGIPLIRTPDIRDGKISLKGAKYISKETYDFWSRRCPPEPGDIIFTREAPMGEAGIIPQGVKLCMGQRMMLLRPMPEFVNPQYVLLNILSLDFQQRMNDQAIGTGVKHLRVADVESLTFPLPPLEEQTEIVRRVEEFFAYADKVEQQVQHAQERVNKLTQSILAKAFRGELTELWRNDNPDLISGENSAEALLDKIKAEREAAKPKKKTRKKA